METEPRSSAGGRVGTLLCVVTPLLIVAALDLGLAALGRVPPDDPLLFYSRSHDRHFSPFVEGDGFHVEIRSDWVSQGNGLRGAAGSREGRVFLRPGFRPARFSREKPERGLRIFALGGSTTFGAYVGPESAFPGLLQQELARRLPERSIEVINLGCPGWASDRVANLMPTLVGLEPDLIVVYSGHNEMLAGDVGVHAGLSAAQRLRALLLRRSVLFAWLNHAIGSTLRNYETELLREETLALEAGQALVWNPWSLPAARRRAPRPDFERRAALRYERNLERMVDSAEAARIPLLLLVPVSNLLYPPVIAAAEGNRRRFEAAMEAGEAALARGRAGLARLHFAEALAASPGHGRAHHALGRAWLALDAPGRARSELRRARDLDVRPHRMTSRLEGVLLEVSGREGVARVDLRPHFDDSLSVSGAAQLFADHLHPTRAGHARIVAALLPEALRLLQPEPE